MYTTYNISSDLHVDCHHDNYLNLFDVIASRCIKRGMFLRYNVSNGNEDCSSGMV